MADPRTYTVWVECTRTETYIAPVKVDADEFDDWSQDEVTASGLVEFLRAGPEIDVTDYIDGRWSDSDEFDIVGPADGRDVEVSA